MGILSDLVIGEPGDAEKIARSSAPYQDFDGIDIKGICDVNFMALDEIVTGRAFKEVLREYEPAFTVSEYGPYVVALPQELVTRLASLQAAERAEVAGCWAQTEEFQLDARDTAALADAFERICALATKAVSTGRTLFLWTCL